MKYFHFVVLSISYDCLHGTTRNVGHFETHGGHFDRSEVLFWVIKCHVDTIRNEII